MTNLFVDTGDNCIGIWNCSTTMCNIWNYSNTTYIVISPSVLPKNNCIENWNNIWNRFKNDNNDEIGKYPYYNLFITSLIMLLFYTVYTTIIELFNQCYIKKFKYITKYLYILFITRIIECIFWIIIKIIIVNTYFKFLLFLQSPRILGNNKMSHGPKLATLSFALWFIVQIFDVMSLLFERILECNKYST